MQERTIIRKGEQMKSNKEKMLAGELYDANYDKNLMRERIQIKDKCFEYNTLKPSAIEESGQKAKNPGIKGTRI